MANFWKNLKQLLGSERSHIGAVPRSQRPTEWHAQEDINPTPDSPLQLLSEAQPFQPEVLLSQPVTALLVAGIVNPFGPTLTSVVIVEPVDAAAKSPVVWVMLNPLLRRSPKWVGLPASTTGT